MPPQKEVVPDFHVHDVVVVRDRVRKLCRGLGGLEIPRPELPPAVVVVHTRRFFFCGDLLVQQVLEDQDV